MKRCGFGLHAIPSCTQSTIGFGLGNVQQDDQVGPHAAGGPQRKVANLIDRKSAAMALIGD